MSTKTPDSRGRFGSLAERAAVSLGIAAGLQGRVVNQIVAAHDLTATQYNVLRILRGSDAGCSRRQLCERLLFPSSDVTRLVDRLVRQGLVERHESQADRRLRIHTITGEGLRVIEAVQPALDRMHERLARELGPAGLRAVVESSERVAAVFRGEATERTASDSERLHSGRRSE